MEAVLEKTGMNQKSQKLNWRNYQREIIPVVVIILCSLVFDGWSDGAFISPRNLSNLSRQVCVNLTLAVGMTLVILTSGIDLSVGSVLALSGMAAAISQVQWQWSTMGFTGACLSFVFALTVGGLSGAITGFAVSKLKITPFIVTLGMMVIARGMTLIISSAQAVAPLGETLGKLSSDYLSPESSIGLLTLIAVLSLILGMRQFLTKNNTISEVLKTTIAILALCTLGIYTFGNYRGIPYMVFISILCAAAAIFTLKYTRFGRFIYAIGGNRDAAELSGVPVAKTLWLTYFVMGCLAGLAGVMDSTRVNGAVPSAGELGELDAIAAVVIGGTSLMGGAGSIGGTVLGVLIMGVLNNGMSLVGVSEHYQKVFKGIVIILAVYLDLRSKKK